MPHTGLEPAFRRVYVDRIVMDTTRVFWELNDGFCAYASGAYSFQLQVAETAVETGDWTNVGPPVVDAPYLVDDTQRDFGGFPTAHYRVVLTTEDNQVFISGAAPVWGILGERDLIYAREIIRKSNLAGEFTDTPGWIFKQKSQGELAEHNVDWLTDEVIDPRDEESKGTAIIGGYYAPVEYTIPMSPFQSYNERHPQRGQIDDIVQTGEVNAWPSVRHGDIWVAKYSDLRYFIHHVQYTALLRNYPILAKLTLKMASHKSRAYILEIPGQ